MYDKLARIIFRIILEARCTIKSASQSILPEDVTIKALTFILIIDEHVLTANGLDKGALKSKCI